MLYLYIDYNLLSVCLLLLAIRVRYVTKSHVGPGGGRARVGAGGCPLQQLGVVTLQIY